MDKIPRLKLLTAQMQFEAAEDHGCPQLSTRKQDEIYFSRAVLPNGRTIKLLKTLLTSICEKDCYYCPFRSGRDFRRASFSPDDFSRIFIYLYNKKIVDGIFLSSGIINGGSYTQDQLIKTGEILRYKYNYSGYLHLKIMPGCEYDQVHRSMQIADRLSVNLEAPNPKRLKSLAPKKNFEEELILPLRWINDIRKQQPTQITWNNRWPSSVTQFVVGAVGESDLELLNTTENLYNMYNLGRVYYSRFNPVPDTPLETNPPTPIEREHRLYQASYLLRDYDFSLEELPFNQNGNLPSGIDPKLAWADINLKSSPIELNNASLRELLRIPGIGMQRARAIIAERKFHPITQLDHLTKLGINQHRTAPYILLNGKRPPNQARLF